MAHSTSPIRTDIQHGGYGLRRIPLPRTPVHDGTFAKERPPRLDRGFSLALGFDPVELSEQRRGYLLDAPCLMGGEVLPPSARLALAVEFAPPFLLLRDVVPGVLSHHTRQLVLTRRYPQCRVDAPHRPEGI